MGNEERNEKNENIKKVPLNMELEKGKGTRALLSGGHGRTGGNHSPDEMTQFDHLCGSICSLLAFASLLCSPFFCFLFLWMLSSPTKPHPPSSSSFSLPSSPSSLSPHVPPSALSYPRNTADRLQVSVAHPL